MSARGRQEGVEEGYPASVESTQSVGQDKGFANWWGGGGSGDEGWGRTETGPACSKLTWSECRRCAFSQGLPPVQVALGSLSQQNTGLSLGRSPPFCHSPFILEYGAGDA